MKKNNFNNRNKITKTLLYYYILALLAVFLFNWFLMPMYMSRQVKTTTYSDFIIAVEAGEVSEVYFTDAEINYIKEENGKICYYKTGIVDNPTLPQLLQEKGVSYGAEIPEKPNLFLSTLLSYGIPILIFSFIGKRINKNMTEKMGAAGLSIHGRGVAKVYTPEEDKKTFEDELGKERLKKTGRNNRLS